MSQNPFKQLRGMPLVARMYPNLIDRVTAMINMGYAFPRWWDGVKAAPPKENFRDDRPREIVLPTDAYLKRVLERIPMLSMEEIDSKAQATVPLAVRFAQTQLRLVRDSRMDEKQAFRICEEEIFKDELQSFAELYRDGVLTGRVKTSTRDMMHYELHDRITNAIVFADKDQKEENGVNASATYDEHLKHTLKRAEYSRKVLEASNILQKTDDFLNTKDPAELDKVKRFENLHKHSNVSVFSERLPSGDDLDAYILGEKVESKPTISAEERKRRQDLKTIPVRRLMLNALNLKLKHIREKIRTERNSKTYGTGPDLGDAESGISKAHYESASAALKLASQRSETITMSELKELLEKFGTPSEKIFVRGSPKEELLPEVERQKLQSKRLSTLSLELVGRSISAESTHEIEMAAKEEELRREVSGRQHMTKEEELLSLIDTMGDRPYVSSTSQAVAKQKDSVANVQELQRTQYDMSRCKLSPELSVADVDEDGNPILTLKMLLTNLVPLENFGFQGEKLATMKELQKDLRRDIAIRISTFDRGSESFDVENENFSARVMFDKEGHTRALNAEIHHMHSDILEFLEAEDENRSPLDLDNYSWSAPIERRPGVKYADLGTSEDAPAAPSDLTPEDIMFEPWRPYVNHFLYSGSVGVLTSAYFDEPVLSAKLQQDEKLQKQPKQVSQSVSGKQTASDVLSQYAVEGASEVDDVLTLDDLLDDPEVAQAKAKAKAAEAAASSSAAEEASKLNDVGADAGVSSEVVGLAKQSSEKNSDAVQKTSEASKEASETGTASKDKTVVIDGVEYSVPEGLLRTNLDRSLLSYTGKLEDVGSKN